MRGTMRRNKSIFVFVVQLLCLTLALALGNARAQEIETLAGSKVSPQEATRLREVLATPAPAGATNDQLDRFYRELDAAAFKLGDIQERERVLREWSQSSKNLDGRWTYASFLLGTEKVEEGFQRFEALLKELKFPDQKVRMRARLAMSYIDQSNYKRAEALLNEASDMIKIDFATPRAGAGAYWFARADMEFNTIRARLYMRQGRFAEALEAARLANARGNTMHAVDQLVDERQRTFGRSGHAWAVAENALVYMAMGRLLDADDMLRQAYALYKKYDLNEDAMLVFYRRVGDLRFNEGHYAEAIKVYQKVRGILQRQGANEGAADMLFTRIAIARSLVASGQWEAAAKEFSEMDAAVGSSPTMANIVRQSEFRSQVYMQVGPVSRARTILQGTLKWHTENYGPNHYYTSIVRGLYAASLSINGSDADRANARREFEVAVNDMMAPGTLTTDYQENAYRKSVKNFILKSYLTLLSSAQFTSDGDAAEAFKAANNLIASSVQQAIAESAARAGVTQPALAALVRQDQDAKNELSVLYSYISAQGSEGSARRTPEIVNAMRARIKELEALRRDVKNRVQKEFPEYFQLIQPKVPTPAEVAAHLQPGDLFVSVLPMDDSTYVFAVGSNGRLVFLRSNLTQADMAQKVRRLRNTLDVAEKGERAPAFDFATGYALYKELLQPLEPVMQGKKHLILAASGTLGQIPFAVLPTREWTSGKSVDAPWLIRQYAMSSVPSANAWMSLQRLVKAPSGNQSLIAWGDPQFGSAATGATPGNAVSRGATRAVVASRKDLSFDLDKPKVDVLRYGELPALPETRDEVIALGKTLNADVQRDVILGTAATRDSVLAASKEGRLVTRQVVVFATHGLLPGDLPNLDQPALAMATPSKQDGSPLLTLDDVLGLRMNADWVVLSACNTAGADGKAEEAMSGLARGFFYAGSRSLLVTHWSVESESAMQLTTATFAQYQSNPKTTRADALRSAMLKVMAMEPYAHPAFWAPYALVGEGGR